MMDHSKVEMFSGQKIIIQNTVALYCPNCSPQLTAIIALEGESVIMDHYLECHWPLNLACMCLDYCYTVHVLMLVIF